MTNMRHFLFCFLMRSKLFAAFALCRLIVAANKPARARYKKFNLNVAVAKLYEHHNSSHREKKNYKPVQTYITDPICVNWAFETSWSEWTHASSAHNSVSHKDCIHDKD